MTYPISSQLKPSQQPTMGYTNVPLQGGAGLDGGTIKDSIGDTAVAQKVKKTDNPAVLLALMLPIWAGLNRMMVKFNAACADRPDGGKNVLDKIGDFGDRIGQKGIFQSNTFTKMHGWATDLKTFVNTKIIDKSRVLSAMFRTPSKPTNSMVLTMSGGTTTELITDATQIFEEYERSGKPLSNLGLTKEKIAAIRKSPKDYVDEVIAACKEVQKVEPNAFVNDTRIMNIKMPKFLSRKVYFSEIVNKLEALKGFNNPKQATMLGKVLPKAVIRVLEGMTNGTAGGAIAIFMAAYIFADAVRLSIKAPLKEKVSTFMESMSSNLGWYLTMPLGIGLMHNVGGLQYIGMDKDKVESYRKSIESFNEKVKARGFASKAEYMKERNLLRHELKGDLTGIKGFLARPLKWVGRVMTVGLETVRPFISKETTAGAKFGNAMGKFKYGFKNAAGYPMRFLPFMLIIAPFLGNLAAKASNLIFGRPTKSILDKESDKKEEAAPVVQPPVVNQPQVQPAPQPAQQPAQPLVAPISQAAPVQAQAQAPAKEAPAKDPTEPIRTYIPSSAGVKIQPGSVQSGQPNDKINSIFNKADYAEKQAMELLGGH